MFNKKWINNNEALAFLQSASYKKFLKDIAFGMSGDIVNLNFFTKSEELGYSDGKTINVNLMPLMFKDCTLKELTTYHIALIVHEFSHVLYTAFRFVRECANPRKKLLKHIFNIVCDGRIERISSFKLPGYAISLYALNKAMDEMGENYSEDDYYNFLISSLWRYSKLGYLPSNKVLSELPEEVCEDWEKIRVLCRDGRKTDICETCYIKSQDIASIIEKYMPDDAQFPESAIKDFSGLGQGLNGDTGEADDREDDESASDSSEENENKQSSQKGDKDSSEDNDDFSNGTSKGEDNESSDGDSSDGASNEEDNEVSDDDSSDNSNSTSDEDGQSKASEKNGVPDSEDSDGEPNPSELEEKMREFFDNLESSLTTAKEQFEIERETEKHDKKLLQNAVNENKNMSVNYAFADDRCVNTYNFIKSKTAGIISNMKRKLYNVIQFNDDEITRRISRGRIDSKSLSNIANGRVCSSFKEKSEETDLNVTFILDRSGSMDGSSAEKTLAASVIMEETLELLKIPYSFVAFGSKMTILNHWQQNSKMKKYSLMNYYIEGCTALHSAIALVNKSFVSKQKNNDRIVFVITDGYPDSIEAATAQIKNMKKSAQVFGIGIAGASDEQCFTQMFGKDFFIYINNLEDLPLELTNILKRNLLRKE